MNGSRLAGIVILAVCLPMLAACGGKSQPGAQMQWTEGGALAAVQTTAVPTAAPGPAASAPTSGAAPTAGVVPTAASAPIATQAPGEPTAPVPPSAPIVSGPAGDAVKLTAAELETYKPNEIGLIPILEYHQLVKDSKDEAAYVRPIAKFKKDLQWLYDHNFYVVSVRDIVENTIAAPAGKHPVALTFDDSTAGHFRYLIAGDGSVTIDPNSAVGAMQEFYAAHSDFGRGGYFAVITSDSACFNWQGVNTEDDQTKFCHQKIKWLLDNGYEVGNHTQTHDNLSDMTDEKFLKEIGQPFEWLNAIDPRNDADIFTVPFGVYPDKNKHHQQRLWMTGGFTYNGQDDKFIAVMNVGAEPTVAVNSSSWDPLFLSRIQMDDGTDYGFSGYWFPAMAGSPSWLYTSDGNPNTITVPNPIPNQDGDINEDSIAEQHKELIRY